MNVGASWGATGAAAMLGGAAISAAGAPEVGAPVAAGGLFVASAGGYIGLVGLVATGLGSLLLAASGDNQSVGPAAANVATTIAGNALTKATGLPAGTPSPLDPLGDMVGGDPCR